MKAIGYPISGIIIALVGWLLFAILKNESIWNKTPQVGKIETCTSLIFTDIAHVQCIFYNII